jgi:hypothetical protein
MRSSKRVISNENNICQNSILRGKMKQREQVIEAMRQNGGFATFGKLNTLLDFSTWKTKTPQATVRRIVQDNSDFFRIHPGLWALTEYKDDILEKFNIKEKNTEKEELFSHAYYQGLIVEIGNIKGLQTRVPPQDKNKMFLDKPLKNIASLEQMYDFTYENILRSAKTVDVVWFNMRKLPDSFFEVEHSTNIEHSLIKFSELQDYFARFYIVAPKFREEQFNDLLHKQIFATIKNRVTFFDYDSLSNQHTKMYELANLSKSI